MASTSLAMAPWLVPLWVPLMPSWASSMSWETLVLTVLATLDVFCRKPVALSIWAMYWVFWLMEAWKLRIAAVPDGSSPALTMASPLVSWAV